MEIKEPVFRVIVKPKAPESRIAGFDREKNAYIVSVRSRPEGNKANIELLKLLSKATGKRLRIKSGFSSREKIIEAVNQ